MRLGGATHERGVSNQEFKKASDAVREKSHSDPDFRHQLIED
jgi:hypothetical protein